MLNKKYLLILFAIVPVLVLIQTADATGKQIDIQFQTYEDGVTYITREVFGGATHTNIIFEGEEIKCQEKNGYGRTLNPQCVEIILRTSMDNDN